MITVKDIREKDFSLQKRGYSEDEVDDFLDAIADQLSNILRENRDYQQRAEQAERQRDEAYQKLEELETAPDAVRPETEKPAKPAPTPVQDEKPACVVDDATYIENLKTALREALISAQRIADDTVAEAQKKAQTMVDEADRYSSEVRQNAVSEAEKVKENLESETEQVKRQLENLKSEMQGHKAKFVEMIKTQLKALGEDAENAEHKDEE